MLFEVTRISFFGEIISRDGLQSDPRKLHTQTEMLPPIMKRITITFRCNELPRKILTFNQRFLNNQESPHHQTVSGYGTMHTKAYMT